MNHRLKDPNSSTESIVELAQALIKVPSQGGIDSCGPILGLINEWLTNHGIPNRCLADSTGAPVAVVAELSGKNQGAALCLNACVDTAPFGDLTSWRVTPTSAEILDGWLYGRGSADSKIAVSIFCHIALYFRDRLNELACPITFLFDGDEHTGNFGGIKAYIRDNRPRPLGVAIGYPGNDYIRAGARGFYRTELITHGVAAHSGGSSKTVSNAIEKAAALVGRLRTVDLPSEPDPDFSFGPRITVTAISGGHGYSMVPDRCSLNVDFRLTPSFDKLAASEVIRRIVNGLDAAEPSAPTTIIEHESWPAYKLPDSSLIVRTLRRAASKYFGRQVSTRISGPSNIGNYLFSLGVEATCGFGVSYRNIHAPNESVDINTIPPVYATYCQAIGDLSIST